MTDRWTLAGVAVAGAIAQTIASAVRRRRRHRRLLRALRGAKPPG